jgi:DNA-binding beta-propeller fold protein YncE
LSHAQFIAVDPVNGNFYVSVTQSPPAGAVLKFAASANGATAPLATLSDTTRTHFAEGVWVDSAQHLYVVSQFHLIETGANPTDLSTIIKDINGSKTLLNDDLGMAVTSGGQICVAGSQYIAVFKSTDNGSATASAIMGAGAPWASVLDCAMDASGNFFGSNFNGASIFEFASTAPKGPPNFSGNTAPTRTIVLTGTNPRPYGMAFDAAGNLYVADYGDNLILVFDHLTFALTKTIGGPSTGLAKPIGLAVH